MLMLMIGSHPRISVPEATWYYPRFRPYLYSYGDLNQEANFHTLAEEMIFGVKPPFFGLKVNPRTVVDEVLGFVRERSFPGIFAGIMSWYASLEGKVRWGEKTPNNVFQVSRIREDFPNAQFIFIFRDGRDTAADNLRSAFGPRNVFCSAEVWKMWVEAARPWRKELGSTELLEVQYETLVRRPAETLQTICDFIGEAYSPRMLEFHKGFIAQTRGKRRDHKPLTEAVTDRYIGIYREQLSKRDQQIFAAVAREELVEYGYEVEVEPAKISDEEAALYRELDGRVRAATLDAPHGHIVWESYNDWLIDQREERLKKGIWKESDRPNSFPIGDPNEELVMGQRAWRRWKEYFGVKRRYAQ